MLVNVRFLHKADKLHELEVRSERGADMIYGQKIGEKLNDIFLNGANQLTYNYDFILKS